LQLRRALASVLALALPILYAIAQYEGVLSIQSANIAFILFTGSCTILAFVIVKKVGTDGRLGFMHVGIFTCMLLIFLGFVTDGIYAIMLRAATPIPSVADALNFLGYASAAVAGLQFLWCFRAAFGQWQYKLVPVLGVLVACPHLILSHIIVATQMPLIVEATWLAYPILDGILVVLAVTMFLLFRGGIVSSSWLWLAIGMLLITVADIAAGVGNIQGLSQLLQPFYLFYFWGYICLGLGFSMMPGLERLENFMEQDSGGL